MLKKVLVLHGPNLNLLGCREPGVYGAVTLAEIDEKLRAAAAGYGMNLIILQSNHEGELIDAIHRAGADAIIINAGAFTHYSYAIADALRAVSAYKIEVHLSNIHAREDFRHRSVLAAAVNGQISGFGEQSYLLALQAAAATFGEIL